MPTRKQFKAKANEINKIMNPNERREEAKKNAERFKGQNPRFDRQKFYTACNVDPAN